MKILLVQTCSDLIVIEHDTSYLAPNVQGVEQTPITTVIGCESPTDTFISVMYTPYHQ